LPGQEDIHVKSLTRQQRMSRVFPKTFDKFGSSGVTETRRRGELISAHKSIL